MNRLEEKNTEANIQRAILDYLAVKNIFHWRHNVGAGYFSNETGGKKRFVRFGERGQPDIFALVKGRFYGIEIKNHKGEQSDEQKEYEKQLKKHGGIYILARSIDDVAKLI